MARTSETITQNEIDTFAQFFKDHPEIDTSANGEVISKYIAEECGEDITTHTLAVAVQKLRGHLEVLSPAKTRYSQLRLPASRTS